MNSEELIQTQRHLRSSLLDAPIGPRVTSMRGSADLTAHMLLYLDDSERCWQLALQWLRRTLDADRTDGGFSRPDSIYQPQVESLRHDAQIPSSVGTVIDAREQSVRCVWDSSAAVVFENVNADRRFTPALRAQLLSMGTHAKLAIPLHTGNAPNGLICCDWTRAGAHWSAEQCQSLSEFAQRVLSPVFSAIYRARRDAEEAREREVIALPGAVHLTQAELSVARLAVQGLSYKEIARQLNRSFSTVDHRLRTIRDKLGASSTARMICMLSDILTQQYPE